jgi:hypothetical protein
MVLTAKDAQKKSSKASISHKRTISIGNCSGEQMYGKLEEIGEKMNLHTITPGMDEKE